MFRNSLEIDKIEFIKKLQNIQQDDEYFDLKSLS